jgi:hypothetical protein
MKGTDLAETARPARTPSPNPLPRGEGGLSRMGAPQVGAPALAYRYSPASFSTRAMLSLVMKPGPELMLLLGMTP